MTTTNVTFAEAANILGITAKKLHKDLRILHACIERGCGWHYASGFGGEQFLHYENIPGKHSLKRIDGYVITGAEKTWLWISHFAVDRMGVSEHLANAFWEVATSTEGVIEHPAYQDVLNTLAK